MTLRFLTAGESHGPALSVILEGFPAGVALAATDLQPDLSRRQRGFGAGGRMKLERDAARFVGGVMNGHSTGAPIALTIENLDHHNWAAREIAPMTIPRPGHADLTGAIKYGYRDLRLALERASARETAARVAIGAICKRLLAAFDVRVGAYVTRIGAVEIEPDPALDYPRRFELAEQNELRTPDPQAAAAMQSEVERAVRERDTLGGIIEIVALGLPPGLGSYVHYDRRLDGRLLGALASVNAIKGAEIGRAFADAGRRGTEVHDGIALTADGSGRLTRRGNAAGGLEGGITNGMPVVLRAAMKPIATTLTPLPSVDLATGQPADTRYERSDFCAVPRAAVVCEAMVAYVLADALLEKLGGDSLAELQPRFAALRGATVEALPMDGVAWRLGYDTAGDEG